MKTCTKCGESKPLTEFGNLARNKDGKRATCKACKKITDTAYKNTPASKAGAQRYASKPETRAKKNVAQNARYAADPEKHAAVRQAWALANPESVKTSRKKSAPKQKIAADRWNSENREARAAICKRYKDKNPDKTAAWLKAWKARNPDRAREYRQERAPHYAALATKRRAACLNATPAWHETDAVEWLYLDSATRPEASHVDHVIPLQNDIVCGLHCLANLEVIGAVENISKSNSFDQDAESARQLEVTNSLT
jgi:hypothetical protein